MQAIICDQPGVLRLIERPAPSRGAGEVLVRIRRVGICGTDMHIFAGRHPYLEYPRVMGHELSGEVAEADSGFSAGQPVYINPYIACQACHACRRGRPNCCSAIQVLGVHRDGGLCEFLSVPARNVFAADGITLDQAAMIEFLAIGAHAVRRSESTAADRVLVVGTGPIGLGVAFFAQARGSAVTVLDMRQDRLDFCTAALGIASTVLADPAAEQRLAEITGGDFFDVVIDATGNAASMERGFAFVAHTGTYVFVSVVKDRIGFAGPEFHKREMRILGSRNALAEDFDTAVHAIRSGALPTGALNTHRGRLADLADDLPRWIRPETGVVKALVEV